MEEKDSKEVLDDAYKQLLDERSILKRKVAKSLREQLYMTESEIQQVMNIVENAQTEADIIKSKVDYRHYTLKYQKYFGEELNKIYQKMADDIKAKVNEIMKEKAELAERTLAAVAEAKKRGEKLIPPQAKATSPKVRKKV